MKRLFSGIGAGIVVLSIVAFFVARVLAVIDLYRIGTKLWVLVVGFLAVPIGDMFFIGALIASKIWLPVIIYAASLIVVGIAKGVSD